MEDITDTNYKHELIKDISKSLIKIKNHLILRNGILIILWVGNAGKVTCERFLVGWRYTSV